MSKIRDLMNGNGYYLLFSKNEDDYYLKKDDSFFFLKQILTNKSILKIFINYRINYLKKFIKKNC